MNLRPSGYEAAEAGCQPASNRCNPAESLDSLTRHSAPQMQGESSQHKNFGQPVVSELLRPSQAATRFQVPEYLLRKACSEGRIEHVRVVNALWLVPASVAAFAQARSNRNAK